MVNREYWSLRRKGRPIVIIKMAAGLASFFSFFITAYASLSDILVVGRGWGGIVFYFYCKFSFLKIFMKFLNFEVDQGEPI